MHLLAHWRRSVAQWHRRTQVIAGGLALLAVVATAFGIYYVRGPLAGNFLEPNPPGGGFPMAHAVATR